MSTNPKLMDVMGTRPAEQGGPAATGGHPPNLHRGQKHDRYHRTASEPGPRAPFHPGAKPFAGSERGTRRAGPRT